DIAALELYLPLTVGARLVLAERETAVDGRQLQTLLQTRGVTCMQATPATWQVLVETGWDPAPSFTVLCGGEAMPVALAHQLLPKGVRLWNLYGPTETTIWSAIRQVQHEERREPLGHGAESVEPIGHPINNTQIHILDYHAQPQPIGVPGELYIGGDGLAPGGPDQTPPAPHTSIPHPLSAGPRARPYRTAVLVRGLSHCRFDFAAA